MTTSNRMRQLAWLILLVTTAFGLRPFNFFSANDVAFDPEKPCLNFHDQFERRFYWQRAIAYTEDTLYLSAQNPLTLTFELTAARWPNGLGTIVEFDDEGIQPPLIVAQWKNHLVIRSRRAEGYRGQAYREFCLTDVFETGEPTILKISYDGQRTRIYINDKLAESRGYHLLDPSRSVSVRLALGNNATGEMPWFGSMTRVSLYNESLDPTQSAESLRSPILDYRFDKPFGTRIQNLAAVDAPLLLPKRSSPLDAKRFTRISTLKDPSKRRTTDMAVNLIGFIPAGFAIAVLLNRSIRNRLALSLGAALIASAFSFAIESAQVYLPTRNPSFIDWAINSLAGLISAISAALTLNRSRSGQLVL